MAKRKTQETPTRIKRTRSRSVRKSPLEFATVRLEGGLLTPDLLAQIAANDPTVPGLAPTDYNRSPSERIGDRVADVWATLKKCWRSFQEQLAKDPSDYGTSATRAYWLLPLFRELDFGVPDYTPKGVEIGGKQYRLSHQVNAPVAVHLVSSKQDLDSRDLENRAGARISPHSLVQEYINRAPDRLWGIASNGLKFRILRDNVSFSTSPYIEFDLQTIFETDSYADFYLFYLVAHASRFAKRADKSSEFALKGDDDSGSESTQVDNDCWIEQWRAFAQETGVRSLDGLRDRVEDAITTLGAGFLAVPYEKNADLKNKLASGELSALDYYRALLQLVYRIVFVMIAEDRGLFFPPNKIDPSAKKIYEKYYSTASLRKLARREQGSERFDLWERLKLTLSLCAKGEDKLGIPALDSALFSKTSIFDDLRLANSALLKAIKSLSHTTQNNVLQPINFRNLGVEELGSVYESLLERKPTISKPFSNLDVITFELKTVAGNERKTTGSYYTPSSLVSSLLDTALEPTLEERLAGAKSPKEREERLLSLKICDPACGSGCFLIGAARRLGKRLAQIRTQDEEPSPSEIRTGIRDVVSRCLYGVDINPMAVELCKVSLWLESMEPGKSLLFLDHRIKCGNSLFGATRALIDQGIPDAAYDALEGDNKDACKAIKNRHSDSKRGQRNLERALRANENRKWNAQVTKDALDLEKLPDDDPKCYKDKESKYLENKESIEYNSSKAVADLWCATFVWKKMDSSLFCPTDDELGELQTKGLDFFISLPGALDQLRRYVEEYQFFHWELEFPTVFPEEGDGGFDVVFGNPPWEKVKLQEKEWFAQRDPQIAKAPNKAAREKLIRALKDERPELLGFFKEDVRKAEATSRFLRTSGRYPLCGRGDVNTYTVFAELNRGDLVAPNGRVGCIVPSGIATDDTTKFFFQDLVTNNVLENLYDFENRKKLFRDVDSRFKFSLITMGGARTEAKSGAELAFFNLSANDLRDPERTFRLSPSEIALINPNTRTCPIFRSGADALLTKAIYRRVPVLIREESASGGEENPWGVRFSRMFDMANDSHLFRTSEQLEAEGFERRGEVYVNASGEEYLRLYEAKMANAFDHRAADVIGGSSIGKGVQLSDEEHRNIERFAESRYWIPKTEVVAKVGNATYLMGIRDIARATDVRTAIPQFFPLSGIGHTTNLIYTSRDEQENLFLYALLASYCCDYFTRQNIGGIHLTQHVIKQLPILPPERYTPEIQSFVTPRVLELCHTATDLRGFAKSLGYEGEPFVWDEARRFLLRCELDALYFGLYFGFGEWSSATEAPETAEEFGELTRRFPMPLDALDYVMETFPIVKRKELADEGLCALARGWLGERGLELGEDFPSKGVIRALYREMSERGGVGGFGSWLDPGPGGDSLRSVAGQAVRASARLGKLPESPLGTLLD